MYNPSPVILLSSLWKLLYSLNGYIHVFFHIHEYRIVVEFKIKSQKFDYHFAKINSLQDTQGYISKMYQFQFQFFIHSRHQIDGT